MSRKSLFPCQSDGKTYAVLRDPVPSNRTSRLRSVTAPQDLCQNAGLTHKANEEIHEQRRKAHSSRRIRVEHGIAHLKNWRALARHHRRREHMSDIIQAVAALLSRQQSATLTTDDRV
ncbi:transposase [Streptomyces canus]|uniref:transposase n=1 Tax=Streptomyces canus TaxID=58343 RepID=UPI00339F91BB